MIFDIVIVLGFILLQGWTLYQWREDREKLLKMFMAKDLREVTDNEALEKIPKTNIKLPPEVVSTDEMLEDEKLFDKHIAAVKKQAEDEANKDMGAPI